MKIDNAQALTAQSTPFVGRQVDALAKRVSSEVTGETVVSAPAPQPESAKPQLTSEMVAQVNDAIKIDGSQLQFQLDQDAGKMVLYLKDAQTGETLRQFPDKEALRISKQIGDYLEGLKSHQNPKDAVGSLSGLITDTKV
jgi:flagellar protein FlaG